MTIVRVLQAVQKFLKENVANDIQLQMEETNPPQHVNPYVEICFTPHKNFSENNFQVPYILVSFDEDDDDGQEDVISIRITFATYGGGMYKDEERNNVGMPDAKGYIDLLNIMELTKQKLFTASIIGGVTALQKPVRRGIYDVGNTWPYWFGWMTFQASLPATEYLLTE